MHATGRWNANVTIWVIGLLAGPGLLADQAAAGGQLATPPNATWKSECGSCHVAYPPQLLPRQTWQRLMSGLERHFGTDASVEPAAAAEIEAYLERHSSSGRAAGPAGNLRITQSAWFVHEHDDVPSSSWSLPAVGSASNCAACHVTAEQADFRKRNLRVPR